MARNRMIKVDFWSDEKTGTLSTEEQILFIGLWNYADDIGVSRGNNLFLKGNIFPYNNKVTIKKIEELKVRLIEKGLIIEAKFNKESFILVKNFTKHQTINKPSKFRFVTGSENCNVLELFNSRSTTTPLPHQSRMKVKEKEKEKEKEKVSGSTEPLPSSSFLKCKKKVNDGKLDKFTKIVDYLNSKVGTKVKSDSLSVTKNLPKILKKYSIDQVNSVIDLKVNEWLSDEKMCKHLRPETLFRLSNFEKYLDQLNNPIFVKNKRQEEDRLVFGVLGDLNTEVQSKIKEVKNGER